MIHPESVSHCLFDDDRKEVREMEVEEIQNYKKLFELLQEIAKLGYRVVDDADRVVIYKYERR